MYTRDKPSNKQTAEVVRISRRIHLCNPYNRLATHVAATYSPGNPHEVWYQVHRANRVDWVESGVGAWQLVTRQPGVSGDDVCRFIGAHQRWAWACSTSRSPHGSAMTSNSQVPPDKGLCHQEVAPDLGLQLRRGDLKLDVAADGPAVPAPDAPKAKSKLEGLLSGVAGL